ncbi:MAG: hypothetical protein ACLPJH_15340 [Myxococcaceae bacterium]
MAPSTRFVVLRLSGALLVALGALHLTVTPFIAQFIRTGATPDAVDWLMPPMLLNHVGLGILLLPLGSLTLYSARPASVGVAWALAVSRTVALAIVALPPTLFALMGTRYFAAIPFLVAAVIVCVASVTLLVAAFWPAPASPH